MFGLSKIADIVKKIGFKHTMYLILVLAGIYYVYNSNLTVNIHFNNYGPSTKVADEHTDNTIESSSEVSSGSTSPARFKVTDIIEFMKNIPLFFGVDIEALEKLSSIVEQRSYDQGSIVIYKGDAGNSAYIVVQGRLKAYVQGKDDRQKTLSLFESGNYFGELSLFGQETRTAFVKAMSKCDLLMIPKEPFLKLIFEYPAIAINFLNEISNRLSDTNEQVSDSYFAEADYRITKSLKYLSENASTNEQGQKVIKNFPVTEIAYITGTARPTASKIINNLKSSGYIKVQNKDIILLRNDLDTYAA